MKKIIYLLAVLLCCSVLSSCGGGNESNTVSESQSDQGSENESDSKPINKPQKDKSLDDTRDFSNESLFEDEEDEDDELELGGPSDMQVCRESLTHPSHLWIKVNFNVNQNGKNGILVNFGLNSNPYAETRFFKIELVVMDKNGYYIHCRTVDDGYLHQYTAQGFSLPVGATGDGDFFLPYELLKDLVKGRSYYIKMFFVDGNDVNTQCMWSEPIEFHMN